MATVLGSVVIDSLTTEAPTTPARVALVYAAVLSASAIAGWCWWQRDAWRRAPTAFGTGASLVLFAVAAPLAVRMAELWWLAPAVAPSGAAGSGATVTTSALLLACVVRPLAHEALLRGYLLRALRAFAAPRESALLFALLGAALGGSIAHAASNAALAALLTIAALRTGRLWLAAVAHVAFAFLSELVRTAPGLSASAPETVVMAPLLALVVCGAIAGVLRSARLLEIRPPRAAPPMPSSEHLASG